ncbi:MAG: hypothetical protein ACRERC_07060 [Candidatus Binatia bacterium]
MERIRAYAREVSGDDLEAGGLSVTTTDVTTDGRIAKVRGKVRSRFKETVEGVRYLVTIYEDGATQKVLDRWQRRVDTRIEPGGTIMMRLDVESMYFGRAGRTRFGIEASPAALGDQPVPPPNGWVGTD